MSEAAVESDGRYWAFISYSHKDAVFGRRLHRRMEAYALPRRLVGQAATSGAVPRRLAPIFRDRDEFPAATDLSVEVRAALKASRSLIVVCSPTAAQSPWVAREIELFAALHPGRPILAAIREGDPHDCFPEALRRAGPDGAPVEPLAADFRRGHDGWDLGLLKLIAGVLGVGLDELIRRDAQRRARRVTAVTAAALALVLVMAVLTLFAISARSEAERQRAEAERQRAEAEGLVEFMLTDLRRTLKGVGRLDAMTAVNQQALDYYGKQELRALPPESLERRASILHVMGEDDETRGDHDAALVKFREARRTTAALLAQAPNDPDRIFNQSQSEFYFGYVDYNRGRYAAAKPAFLEYKRLTDRLVAIAPKNPIYQREAGYAEGNLCSMALLTPGGRVEALRACAAALRHMQRAASANKPPSGIGDDLLNRLAWLADAYHAAHDIPRARSERIAQEHLINAQLAADPRNMNLKDWWATAQRALAVLDFQSGDKHGAITRLRQARIIMNELIKFDPANKRWIKDHELIDEALSQIQ